MSWIKTLTGRHADFITPNPEELDLRDIFLSLSRNHRFGGHSPLKVGQHILEVTTLMLEDVGGLYADGHDEAEIWTVEEMAEIGLIAMIHDMPEFAVGDVPTPLKRLLGPTYAEIEDRILRMMLRKWDLEAAWEKHYPLLKKFDQDAVEQEALRFGLDGIFIDDDNVKHRVANEWVPERGLTLKTEVWPQDLVVTGLAMTWSKLMFLSGREDMIPRLFWAPIEETVADTGISAEEGFSGPNPALPPLLINEVQYL